MTTNYIRKVYRAIWKRVRGNVLRHWFRTRGIRFVYPNFLYLAPSHFENNQCLTVIDVGCGSLAELSIYMINRYGAKCYGVDPTEKHQTALSKLAHNHPGHFIHVPYAVGAYNGEIKFFESNVNESGSLMTDHVNAVRDEGISYQVKCLTPKSLIDHLGIDSADILKLDIEGAEYELLQSLSHEELLQFKQIFIEFHHHAVERYTYSDTIKAVESINKLGYISYSLDNHNFLFLRLD